MELMQSMATKGQDGKSQLSLEDGNFEILLQKEKDKFYLETGYYTEQVSSFMRELKAKAEFDRRADWLLNLW